MAQLNPPSNTCQADLLVTTLTPPTVDGFDLRFFIGNPSAPPATNTPITNPIPISAGMTAEDIQNAINANIIVSGVTITVINFDSNGLEVIIQKSSSEQINDSAIATYTNQVIPPASFVCNLRRGGGAGGIGFIPSEFIKVPKEKFPEGAPEQVIFRGTTYYYLSEDEINFYYSKNPSYTQRTIWQASMSGTVTKG